MVYLSPSFTHRMTQYWTKPFDFDPARFDSPRLEHKQKKMLFMGFGGGAHVCIGQMLADMQIKLLFWHMLRSYKISLIKPEQDYSFKFAVVPIPKDGLPIRLERL